MYWLILSICVVGETQAQLGTVDPEWLMDDPHKADRMPVWGGLLGMNRGIMMRPKSPRSPFSQFNIFGNSQARSQPSTTSNWRKLVRDFYQASFWHHYMKLLTSKSGKRRRTTTTTLPTLLQYQPHDIYGQDFVPLESSLNNKFDPYYTQTNTSQMNQEPIAAIVPPVYETNTRSSPTAWKTQQYPTRLQSETRIQSHDVQQSTRRYSELPVYAPTPTTVRLQSNNNQFSQVNEPVKTDMTTRTTGRSDTLRELYKVLLLSRHIRNQSSRSESKSIPV